MTAGGPPGWTCRGRCGRRWRNCGSARWPSPQDITRGVAMRREGRRRSGDDGAVFEDRARAHACPRADAHVGPHDAVGERGARAYRDALPEHGALQRGAGSDDAAGAQHPGGSEAGMALEPAARADDDRRARLDPRPDDGVGGDGRLPAAGGNRANVSVDAAGEQVEMRLAVLGRTTDVEPVAL